MCSKQMQSLAPSSSLARGAASSNEVLSYLHPPTLQGEYAETKDYTTSKVERAFTAMKTAARVL